jgi:hypothetical protein
MAPFPPRSEAGLPELVKTNAATTFREGILRSELKPGEIISETPWRPRLGVLFAFSLMRAMGNQESTKAWFDGVDGHLLVTPGIRSKDPSFAGQATRHAIGRFVAVAREVWAGQEPERDKKRSHRIAGGRPPA